MGVNRRAMKTMNKIFALAAAAVAVVACTNEANDIQKPVNLVPVEFSASMDEVADPLSKTTLFNNAYVKWEATDKVTLLSGENYSVATELSIKEDGMAEDGSWANFVGLADEGSEAFIAVYPHSAANKYENGTVSVTIPSEQVCVKTGMQSGANVSVAASTGADLKFRNVGTLLGYEIFGSVASVTDKIQIRAKKADGTYAKLTGTAQVTIGEDGIPVATEGSEEAVTLLAPEGGFVAGVFYFVVYPGEYQALEYTFVNKNGNEAKWTSKQSVTLGRSERHVILNIPSPYDVALPEEVHINWNFVSNWPFVETCLPTAQQATQQLANGSTQYTGDTYTYVYEHAKGKNRYTMVIKGQDGTYSKASSYLLMSKAKSRLSLPVLPGMAIKSVEVGVQNTATYPKSIKMTLADSYTDFVAFPDPVSNTAPGKLEFPLTSGDTTITPEAGQRYWLYFTNASTQVAYVNIVYAKPAVAE